VPTPREKRGFSIKAIFAGGLLIIALANDPHNSDVQSLANVEEELLP
jgi:hypothetical protein